MTEDGSVPETAFQGGFCITGDDIETLYVGRAAYQGSLTPGKIQLSHGRLYIPYGGREQYFESNFEYLMLREFSNCCSML